MPVLGKASEYHPACDKSHRQVGKDFLTCKQLLSQTEAKEIDQ